MAEASRWREVDAMSREPQSHPRASDVCRDFLRAAVRGGLPLNKFSARLVDAYHARVPVHERETEFHVGTTGDALVRAEKANAKLVTRVLDGAVKFPLDLLEAWCEALPPDMSLECRRALVRRLGFVGALPPNEAGPVQDISALACGFGQTMRALGPILADGTIDVADAPALLRKALREMTDLSAAIVTLQRQCVDALDAQGGAHA
jgi:hypothetical protein